MKTSDRNVRRVKAILGALPSREGYYTGKNADLIPEVLALRLYGRFERSQKSGNSVMAEDILKMPKQTSEPDPIPSQDPIQSTE